MDQDLEVELIRGDRDDGPASYLLYVPAPGPNAPVVVMNEPYSGIDWTGEAVDAKWAARGDGLHPDDDAPNYSGSDYTLYGAQSVAEAVDADVVWRLNGFAVIHAYARFYSGGDVEGDAIDAAAAYAFASARQQELDLTRIGALGGSWGGMMTLFGARRAPEGARPIALAALTPLSDFVDQHQWTDDVLATQYARPADAEAFFSPYWRRAAPSMGYPPAGAASVPFTHAGLCPGLPGKAFVPHDDWDLLIPVRQTEGLAAACGAQIEPLYWRRAPVDFQTAPLDHGPLGAEPQLPSMLTFAWTFLATELAQSSSSALFTAGSEAALEEFLTLVSDAQRTGRDPGVVLPRLRELAAPRVQLYEAGADQFVPGGDALARVVNRVYQTSYDAAALRAQLATGLPTPP